jgi:hypothetical protein
MLVDNLLLLESMFLPEYKNRLPVLLRFLSEGKTPEAKVVIERQLSDLKKSHSLELTPNLNTFEHLLNCYHVALLNRIKAFKSEQAQ